MAPRSPVVDWTFQFHDNEANGYTIVKRTDGVCQGSKRDANGEKSTQTLTCEYTPDRHGLQYGYEIRVEDEASPNVAIFRMGQLPER